MASGIQGLFDTLTDGLMILSSTGTVKFANQMVLRWLHAQPGKPIVHEQILKQVHAADQGYQRLPSAFVVDTSSPDCLPAKLQVVMDKSPLGEGYALVVRNRTQEERYDTVMQNFADLFRNTLSAPLNQFMRGFADLQSRLGKFQEHPDWPLKAEDQALLVQGARLMEKMAQLSSYAFAFSHAPLFASDRIEPAHLIRTLATRVVDKLRRHRLGIRVHGMEQWEMPVVYGSEAWLLEALHGYFSYLADHAREGTVIDIHLRGFGSFVLIVITNQGRVIPVHDREHQYKPFLSAASRGPGKAQEADGLGLGLPLCKQIISLHKGNLRMREEDGEVVSFEIELPAGAPVAIDQHDVSAEQAKRYAEDLALLMQRQAKKKTQETSLQVVREGVTS